MIELIKDILRKWGCLHDWELKHEHEVQGVFGDKRYTSYTYCCKICGKFKRVKSS